MEEEDSVHTNEWRETKKNGESVLDYEEEKKNDAMKMEGDDENEAQ